MSIVNIKYSAFSVITILAIVDATLFTLGRRRITINLNLKKLITRGIFQAYQSFRQLSFWERVMISLIVILLISAFSRALYWPIYYWDALALYDYRAKIFYEAGGIAQSLNLASTFFNIIPPMTSLAHTFFYIIGSEELNVQFIYPFFYLGLILSFFLSVRKFCYRQIALLFTLLLASIPMFFEFSANAYTNLPFAFYFGMGTVYLYRFMQESERGYLFISGLFLGLAGWTRAPTEQFLLVNILVLSLWCFTRRKYFWSPVILLFGYLLFSLPWRIYLNYGLHLPAVQLEIVQAVQAGLNFNLGLDRIINVIRLVIDATKGVCGGSIFLAMLAVVLYPKAARQNIYLLLFLVINFLIFILGSYAISLVWAHWEESIMNSGNRLSMFIPPIALYFTAITSSPFLKKIKNHG
jgi:4-amino-4-deoxy-L-arabinose transferase-like glycosyltransferase